MNVSPPDSSPPFERQVFGSVDSARWYVGVLLALVVAAKALRYWRRRQPRFIDFNELPPLATQRFTLND